MGEQNFGVLGTTASRIDAELGTQTAGNGPVFRSGSEQDEDREQPDEQDHRLADFGYLDAFAIALLQRLPHAEAELCERGRERQMRGRQR